MNNLTDKNWSTCEAWHDRPCLISPRGTAALKPSACGIPRCVRHGALITGVDYAFERIVPEYADEREIRKLWKRYQENERGEY